MESSYKTVNYILPFIFLESASLYCSSRIKLGAAVWYYDKTSDLGIDYYYYYKKVLLNIHLINVHNYKNMHC